MLFNNWGFKSDRVVCYRGGILLLCSEEHESTLKDFLE